MSGNNFFVKQLMQVFLKLGTIGFGGPVAHIAMINDEVVLRRQWLSQEQFSEGLALCEMIPGPASTQMGIYTGYIYGGQIGALIAGICFIAPAFLIVVALSFLYFRFQELPQIGQIFLGVSPVVSAIILVFCGKLAQKNLKNKFSQIISLAVFLGTLIFHFNILFQFIIAGILGIYWYGKKKSSSGVNSFFFLPLYLGNIPKEPLTVSTFWSIERSQDFFLPLSIFFLKVGSFIFGGGLVIIPLLQYSVVEQFKWLTETEFINGVAIGQITPGPVVLTAAFIGYKVAGFCGALISTIAIFLPSFVLIFIAAPLWQKIRNNEQVRNFLQGVNSAVLGSISAVAFPLTKTAIWQETIPESLAACAIMLFSFIALWRFNIPVWKLVLIGALLGIILGFI